MDQPAAFLILLIQYFVGGLIVAVILRAAVKWVLKQDLPFGRAYGIVLVILLINGVLGYIVGYAVASATQSMEAVEVATWVMMPVGLCIQSGILSARLPTTFGRAMLVSLAMFLIGLLIAVVVGLIVFVVVQATQ